MANSIAFTKPEWNVLLKRLRRECPTSWTTIRSVQIRELGFTVRTHSEYYDVPQKDMRGMRTTIYLDFYDDNLETVFRLKYL